MALALDGSVHGNSSSASSLVVSLTTGAGNVVLVAVTSNAGDPTSVASANGETFTKHATSGGQSVSLWSCVTSSAWSSNNITVTLGSSAYVTVDAAGISGADTSNIFDDNASIPDTGAGDPRTVSTDLADTMVIGAFRMLSTSGPTAGSGFTQISGAHFQLFEYKIVSAAQSSLSVTLGTGAGNSNGGVATAVRQASGSAPNRAAQLYNQRFLRRTG